MWDCVHTMGCRYSDYFHTNQKNHHYIHPINVMTFTTDLNWRPSNTNKELEYCVTWILMLFPSTRLFPSTWTFQSEHKPLNMQWNMRQIEDIRLVLWWKALTSGWLDGWRARSSFRGSILGMIRRAWLASARKTETYVNTPLPSQDMYRKKVIKDMWQTSWRHYCTVVREGGWFR